jgi:hypothetical protein
MTTKIEWAEETWNPVTEEYPDAFKYCQQDVSLWTLWGSIKE